MSVVAVAIRPDTCFSVRLMASSETSPLAFLASATPFCRALLMPTLLFSVAALASLTKLSRNSLDILWTGQWPYAYPHEKAHSYRCNAYALRNGNTNDLIFWNRIQSTLHTLNSLNNSIDCLIIQRQTIYLMDTWYILRGQQTAFQIIPSIALAIF